MRVLHCPHGIAGNPQQIARAEREIGLKSHSVVFKEHAFGYLADETLMTAGQSKFALEYHRWRLLARAIRDFDVIHFNFGSTLMPKLDVNSPLPFRSIYNVYARLFHLRDLALLKRLGKVIAMTYQGTDARQSDYCRKHFEIHFFDQTGYPNITKLSDETKRKDIAYVARYADYIYALNPDLLHVLPSKAQFLPYASVDLRDWQPVPMQNDLTKPLVVLHAPSNRSVKGTSYVIEAVQRLQSEGVLLELVLVENLPHDEARLAYERADLLIDQLLAGWYGGLAVELMALGKPVMCYLREGDLGFLPKQMYADLPIIRVTPMSLYDNLKLWATVRRSELSLLGQRSRFYVERWHDPIQIAARLKADYESIYLKKHG